MLNKKIQVKDGDNVYQLWFNNYAMFELASLFGVDQKSILIECQKRVKDNFLVLVADIFYIGYKGQKLAVKEPMDLTHGQVSEIVATADMNDLMQMWEVFKDVNQIKTDDNPDKKKAVKKKTSRKKKS